MTVPQLHEISTWISSVDKRPRSKHLPWGNKKKHPGPRKKQHGSCIYRQGNNVIVIGLQVTTALDMANSWASPITPKFFFGGGSIEKYKQPGTNLVWNCLKVEGGGGSTNKWLPFLTGEKFWICFYVSPSWCLPQVLMCYQPQFDDKSMQVGGFDQLPKHVKPQRFGHYVGEFPDKNHHLRRGCSSMNIYIYIYTYIYISGK